MKRVVIKKVCDGLYAGLLYEESGSVTWAKISVLEPTHAIDLSVYLMREYQCEVTYWLNSRGDPRAIIFCPTGSDGWTPKAIQNNPPLVIPRS